MTMFAVVAAPAADLEVAAPVATVAVALVALLPTLLILYLVDKGKHFCLFV